MIGENVFVKSITFTNGKSTKKVMTLQAKKSNNITAIFLLDQIKDIIDTVKDTNTILSVFAGRIYDSGFDAKKDMFKINEFIKNNSSCQSLWASTRMAYDYKNAIEVKTNIITMQTAHIKKLKMFGTNLKEYSLKTVDNFMKRNLQALKFKKVDKFGSLKNKVVLITGSSRGIGKKFLRVL